MSVEPTHEIAGPRSRVGSDALLGELTFVVWHQRRLPVIPGPDCRACGKTGQPRMPGYGFRGMPNLALSCPDCHRDPLLYMEDRITAKMVARQLSEARATENKTVPPASSPNTEISHAPSAQPKSP